MAHLAHGRWGPLHQELPANPIADPADGSRGRPEDIEGQPPTLRDRDARNRRRELARGRLDPFGVAARDHHLSERAERRVPVGTTTTELLAVEARIVVGTGESDRVVGRQEGLDHDPARLVSSTRSPRHLGQELERALPRTEVGEVQPKIGGDHAHKGDPRDVVTLGDHLRPDQHVDLALVKSGEDPTLLPLSRRRVAIEALDARVGKQNADLLRHPLGAVPEQDPFGAATPGTSGGRVGPVTAVVAAEVPHLGRGPARRGPRRVVDEGDIAVLTPNCVPACMAVDEGREPTTVQEQDRLAATSQRLGQGPSEGPRENEPPASARELLVHVDDLDRGKWPPRDSIGQDQSLDLSPVGPEARLDVGRGGPEQEWAARLTRAQERDIARVVAEAVVALVGRIMLLVEHDQTGVRNRCEDRRASSDDDGASPLPDLAPLIEALPAGESAVQDGDPLVEPRSKAIHDLVRERDLGDEHDRSPTPLQRSRRRTQVDLGLAAPGDPVEEEGRVSPGVDRLEDSPDRLRLVRCEVLDLYQIADRSCRRTPSNLAQLRLDPASLQECAKGRAGGEGQGSGAQLIQDLALSRRPLQAVPQLNGIDPSRDAKDADRARADPGRLRDNLSTHPAEMLEAIEHASEIPEPAPQLRLRTGLTSERPQKAAKPLRGLAPLQRSAPRREQRDASPGAGARAGRDRGGQGESWRTQPLVRCPKNDAKQGLFQKRGRIEDLVHLTDRAGPVPTAGLPGLQVQGHDDPRDPPATKGDGHAASGLDRHSPGQGVVVRLVDRERDRNLDEAVLLHRDLLRRALPTCNRGTGCPRPLRVVRFSTVRGVVVVGSLNVDVSVRAEHLPRAGETVRAAGLELGPGGKGANQAIAAARLGARVQMVGRIGGDRFADIPLAALREAQVDATFVRTSPHTHTGTALIVVDDRSGQNAIAVAGGANRELTPDDVRDAVAAFRAASVLLVQLEAPLETIEAALAQALECGVTTVLDPAPARELPDELLKKVDLLTPNEIEAELLTGIKIVDVESAARAGLRLRDRTLGDVIVTLGDRGCVWVFATGFEHIPGHRVSAIDTTGAGDAFNGGLAKALASGDALGPALQFAVRAGAAATLKRGAAEAMPTPESLYSIAEAD